MSDATVPQPFRYSDEQWNAIAAEIEPLAGTEREMLEEMAARFLAMPTPAELRHAFSERHATLGITGHDCIDLSEKLAAMGLGSPEMLEELVTIGSDLLQFASGEYDDIPQPKGPENPSRRTYLNALCEFWRFWLGRAAGASWNNSLGKNGEPDGPMLRFLIATASPVTKFAHIGPLTRNAADGQIKDFVKALAIGEIQEPPFHEMRALPSDQNRGNLAQETDDDFPL